MVGSENNMQSEMNKNSGSHRRRVAIFNGLFNFCKRIFIFKWRRAELPSAQNYPDRR